MEISQLVAGFGEGDAISNYARSLQELIREKLHIKSNVYSLSRHIGNTCREQCFDIQNYKSSPENVVIFHFSIGSELTDYFRKLPDKKIIIYHNITPPRYFRAISDAKAKVLTEGRDQLATLVGVPELSLADSEYNRRELEDMGFSNTGVLHPLIDFEQLKGPADRKIIKEFKKDLFVTFLFVGRIAPNKKLEDLLKIFFYYKKLVNPASRIIIPGSFAGQDKYLAHLRALCVELDLQEVFFTGFIPHKKLLAYYSSADIFLCMSEHEGFCFPLVEAMYFGIPIIAYDSAAVPETLGDAGILVKTKDYPAIAELAGELMNDETLKSSVISREKKRLAYFSDEKFYERFKGFIDPYL